MEKINLSIVLVRIIPIKLIIIIEVRVENK